MPSPSFQGSVFLLHSWCSVETRWPDMDKGIHTSLFRISHCIVDIKKILHQFCNQEAWLGTPGWFSGWASALGSGCDPGVLGSSSALDSLQGACFSLCLCLYLSMSLMNKWKKEIFKKKKKKGNLFNSTILHVIWAHNTFFHNAPVISYKL